MIKTFKLADGGWIGINPAMVLAVEELGEDRSRIVLGHGIDYVVALPLAEATSHLNR